MDSTPPTKKEILDAIESSGYLIEQRVRKLLVSRHYLVDASIHFEDPDEGVSREIDISAGLQVYAFASEQGLLEIELLIGCRDNRQPLVFFTNRQDFLADMIENSPPISGWPLEIPGTYGGETELRMKGEYRIGKMTRANH